MRMRLDTLFVCGLDFFVRSNVPRILMYHGIAPSAPRFLNHRHISPAIFEQHLIFLKKKTTIITLEDFYDGSFDPTIKNTVLTFDDGYLNNLTFALPLLEKHKVPAYFFVTGLNQTDRRILWSDLHDLLAADGQTNRLDTPIGFFYKRGNGYKPFVSGDGTNLHDYLKSLDFNGKYEVLNTSRMNELLTDPSFFYYWKLLSDEEIKQLDQSPFAYVGSHGFYHNNLGTIQEVDAQDELFSSKNYLESLLGRKVTSIAYPDGSYGKHTVHLASELGYTHQLAVNYLRKEHMHMPHLRDRVGLYDYETLSMQKYKMIR